MHRDAMKWDDELRLGYGPMDEVHEEFVELIGACQRASDDELPALMLQLENHTQAHFEEEDRWMRETAFPPADCHIEQHQAVLASMAEVGMLLAQGRVDVARSLLQALEDWFPQHASQLDSALAHWMFKRQYGGKPLLLRRSVLALGLGATLVGTARAQTYPQRTITLIAPFAPGGSADGIARILARELSASLGQPVVVDNRPGAGGATGLLAVARSTPDGYTLGMGATGALTIAPHLPDATPLRPQQQLQALARVADIPLVLVSSPISGLNTLQDLMARARREDLSVGNSGQYTAHHLSVELLGSMAGLRLVSVPYRGSGPAVTDLVGGQVPAALVDLTSVISQVKAGRARALAVTSGRRTALAPDVPTMAEAGVPGYEAPAWMGVLAPKGVPAAVVQKLSAELRRIMDKPEVRQQVLALAAEPNYMDADEFTAAMEQESQRWARIIGRINGGAK